MCKNALPAKCCPDLLDKYGGADHVGLPISTFEKFARARLFPTVRLGGQPRSRLRFRREDLDAWVESSTTPATAGPLSQGGAE